MYDLLRAIEAPANQAREESELSMKLASLSVEELADLSSNSALQFAFAREMEKTAAPSLGALGKSLGNFAMKNKGMLAGSAIGAAGGAYQGAKDGGGLSGALGGGLMGAAGGAAAGHAAQGLGGRLAQGQGLTQAASGYKQQVGQEASALRNRLRGAPDAAKFMAPSGAAPVSATGRVQLTGIASPTDSKTVMNPGRPSVAPSGPQVASAPQRPAVAPRQPVGSSWADHQRLLADTSRPPTPIPALGATSGVRLRTDIGGSAFTPTRPPPASSMAG